MNLKNQLADKKILFLSVQTFNLEVEITKKLKEFGAYVVYYDERPSNNYFIKGLIRIRRSLFQKRINSYYNKIIIETSKIQFDYLLVNRGEIVPPFFLQKLKKQQQRCQFIFYTWDSFTNHSHPVSILKYFDRKLTFDPDDARSHNIKFRPLFYLDAYKNLDPLPKKFDILFLGTAHSDRFKISSLIKKWALDNGLSAFCYYYIQGRLVYLYNNIFNKSFKEFKYSQLNFKTLKLEEIVTLYRQSNTILDINHPNQKGLTMRTFEAIGAKRKLITTNKDIAKYPFYNKKNILIIDRENIELDLSFINNIYEELEPDLYNKFSLEGWLYNIFIDEEDSFWSRYI